MLGKRYCACRRWRRLGKDSYSDDENYRHSRELESVHARDNTPEQLIRSHFLRRIRCNPSIHSRRQFKRLSGCAGRIHWFVPSDAQQSPCYD